jgi:sulfur relay (sulfurtransferase) DsrF/TusC family protein
MLSTYHNNNKNHIQQKSVRKCIKNLNTYILKYYGKKRQLQNFKCCESNYYVHIILMVWDLILM